MLIIGCDYHPSVQQIAFVELETGETGERQLLHKDGEAERFYRDLKLRGISVRVGIEATGHARWFERLLAELGFELWIGDPAQIKAARVRKQKTDRQDAQLLLKLLVEERFPRRRRLAQGDSTKDSNWARPDLLHSAFLRRTPSFIATALQLIHDSCPHLHQPMPMPQQLAHLDTKSGESGCAQRHNSNSVLHRSWPRLHEITRPHTALSARFRASRRSVPLLHQISLSRPRLGSPRPSTRLSTGAPAATPAACTTPANFYTPRSLYSICISPASAAPAASF